MPLSVSELYRFFRDWHINTTMADYDCLTKSFCCRETGAAEVQKFLDSVAERGGALDDVLSALFAWELQASYWPEGLFDANLCLRFPPSQDFPVEFRTQINYSRRNYVAPTDKRAPKTANPCPICYDGNVDSEHKPLLRAYKFMLGHERPVPYFAQATPFPLVRGHFIVIQQAHEPMHVNRSSLDELLDFVDKAPSFTACSNSDVLMAGVSILGHHHYQVFARQLMLPVMQAPPVAEASCGGGKVHAAMLRYPLATMRLFANVSDRAQLLDIAAAIVDRWKTREAGRNTCNLMTRRWGTDGYELYLFFRNPSFLTPPDLLRIKSEGVGVVEAAGEGIYPPPISEEGLAEIRNHGREILIRILSGLNPIPSEEFAQVLNELTTAL